MLDYTLTITYGTQADSEAAALNDFRAYLGASSPANIDITVSDVTELDPVNSAEPSPSTPPAVRTLRQLLDGEPPAQNPLTPIPQPHALTDLIAVVSDPDGDFVLNDSFDPGGPGCESTIDMIAAEAVTLRLLPSEFRWWFDSVTDYAYVTLDIGPLRLASFGIEMRHISNPDSPNLAATIIDLIAGWQHEVNVLYQQLANLVADPHITRQLPPARSSHPSSHPISV
jgi:hypothetical protein